MYLILTLLTIILLGFNYWGVFVFEGFKFWSFFIGVDLILLIVLFKEFYNLKKSKQKVFERILNYFEGLKFWSLDFLILVYLLVLSFATFIALSFKISFWGLENRYQGLFVWGHYVLFYFLVRYLLKINKISKFNFKKLAYFFVALTGIISVYALFQKFAIDLPAFYQVFTVSKINRTVRVFSTLGHPNYLGMYLVMVLPFFYYLFLKVKSYKVKSLIWLSFILTSLSLLLTLNRGAWIASVGMTCFFLSCLYLVNKKQNLKLSFWKYLQFIIVIIFLSSFFWGSFWGQAIRDRSNSMFDDNLSSVDIRLNEYRFAWQKIKERPILGYGLDNYIFISGERDISEEELAVDNRPSDRVHNLFLDILIRSGFLGLFVFLLIIIKTVHIFCSSFKTKQSLKFLILFSSLLAYFLAIQFHFETVTSSVLMFFFLGLMVNLGKRK